MPRVRETNPGRLNNIMTLSRIFRTLLLGSFVLIATATTVAAEDFVLKAPLGVDLDEMQVPEDNPLTAAKIELGELLYFDGRLSSDGTVSCATCHHPSKGFTDQLAFSKGVDGQEGGRSAPTVVNTAFGFFQFWDGRAPTLEAQAGGPIENPIEMASSHELAVKTVSGIKGYAPYFEKAFGDSAVTIDRITKAIASYERTVLSGNSAWDRYVDGDKKAMSESAIRGLELFEGKANCTRCHAGWNLADGIFHNLGVGMDAAKPDLGRHDVTKKDEDKGAFKTPTLRDIQRTAPYMHDGSVATLEEVIDLYVRGGEKNEHLDVKMVALELSDEEKKDLLAFLKSLEGDWKPQAEPKLPE
jgi:cytochrome c peroxidase